MARTRNPDAAEPGKAPRKRSVRAAELGKGARSEDQPVGSSVPSDSQRVSWFQEQASACLEPMYGDPQNNELLTLLTEGRGDCGPFSVIAGESLLLLLR